MTIGEARSLVVTTVIDAFIDGALLINTKSRKVEQVVDCAPLEPVVGISLTANVIFRREFLLLIDVDENETCFNAVAYDAVEATPDRNIPHPFEVIEL